MESLHLRNSQRICLENRERNGYDDSDFYMIVWNPEEKGPESIE